MLERDYVRERKEASIKLVDDFANLVNGQPDIGAILARFKQEHRTLQQSMFRVIAQILIMISKDDYATDPRNEESKNMAKRFVSGYMEMWKKEDKQRLIESCGYSEEEAEISAERLKQQMIAEPERYLGLSCI